MNATAPVIDRELALQRAGGNKDLAEELFSMLIRDLPNMHKRIEIAYSDSNVAALIEVVHKLNGAATYCGVPALKEAAHHYETALKQGQSDTYDAMQRQLLSEIERVIASSNKALF